MKVIITGSEGFIGRTLSQSLQKRDVEVIGIDRKIGREVADIAKYMPDDLDIVFHLAAQTSVFNSDMIQIRKDNIDSFMAVIDACAKHPNHPKLVYASSSTAEPCNTTSLYGISKAFAEQYARCYYPEATGVRFHNVYGPEPRQGTLLWYLLTQDIVKHFIMNPQYASKGGSIDDTCFTLIASMNKRPAYLVTRQLSEKDLAVEFIRYESNMQSCYATSLINKEGVMDFVRIGTEEEILFSPDTVWRSIAAYLPDSGNLYFCPDGVLSRIGLEYLPIALDSISNLHLHRVFHLLKISGNRGEGRTAGCVRS